MAELPKEGKKFDISGLPILRGAIGSKGSVSRNTRLPSIRIPRDLTLGGQSKRTFVPNIPVRREKKAQPLEDTITKKENIKTEESCSSLQNDRGKGRRRQKQIIQTDSIFEGIAVDKGRTPRESYSRSELSSSKGISIKKEKHDPDVTKISKGLDLLFRDDFIDDGSDDNDVDMSKPTVFPPVAEVKKEKEETAEPVSKEFNPNIAKEMDFDVKRIAKFIKKEKETEAVEKENTVKPDENEIPSNEVIDLLRGETSSNLMLFQFPDFINLTQKLDDSETTSSKKSNSADSKESNDQDNLASIKSLPEGYIGKLQVMKSGKVKLVIGSVDFALASIEDFVSKYEVASININSNPGDLTVLGDLKHRLTFAPNEDCLLYST